MEDESTSSFLWRSVLALIQLAVIVLMSDLPIIPMILSFLLMYTPSEADNG
jgi:hypothetical protein